ncbi:MAG TPA: thioredoxin family protein [Longimicrobiaceae bacterium]|nr:thioredoxin family protein [Longimicrobiaceae bacterium]
MAELQWFVNSTAGEALAVARESGKPLFVDFWAPRCKGCEKMEEVTYRSDTATEVIAGEFVAVKYDTKAPEEHFRTLTGTTALLWTPTLVVLDHGGTEVRRLVGYLPPEELAAELTIALGLVDLLRGRAERALARFAEVGEGGSAAAPEALYWAGVAAWRAGGLGALLPWWDRLQERFPGSPWWARADCVPAEARVGV